jgi:hypothetical protein
MSDVLFIQREDLIRYTLIGGNVDTDKIIPHIKVAQDIHILPILGTKLYEKLQSDISGSTLAGNYSTLLTDFVQPCLIHLAAAEFYQFHAYEVSNAGVFRHQSENATTPSLDELQALITKQTDVGDHYKRRLVDHLEYYPSSTRQRRRMACIRIIQGVQIVGSTDMANSNNWGEIYNSTWWGDEDWSANSLKIDSAPPGFAFTGILDTYTGATAAYSVRKLSSTYTGDALRVRRSSDDTEQDIGFNASNELDTAALLSFVNASYTNYQSDFSSTGQDDLEETNGTGAIDQSVGGVGRAYLFTNTATGSCYTQIKNLLDVGQTTRIQLDYYIPSGQDCDMIILRGDAIEYTRGTTIGDWASIDVTATVDRDDLFLFLGDGGSLSLGSTGNELYLKNIVVTQTTADGAVSKWYDQSGNSNDAINADASEQPLVVSGGSVVTENDKAAIQFDGVDDDLSLSSEILTDTHYVSMVAANTTKGRILGDTTFGYFLESGATNNRFYINFNLYNLGTRIFQTQELVTWSRVTTSSEFFQDGTLINSAAVVADDYKFKVIASSSNSVHSDGLIQELIIFNSDQSSNRTGIETNINDHFSIFAP